MDWQLIVVGLVVAAAVLYIGRQTWRAWFARKGGCGGGCGCGPAKASAPQSNGQVTLIASEHLTLRKPPRPNE